MGESLDSGAAWVHGRTMLKKIACAAGIGIVTGGAAGSVLAQAGISYSAKAYATYEEAMDHLLPVPLQCVDAKGSNECKPSFSLEVASNPRRVVWRPTRWVRPGARNTYCVLASSVDRHVACDTPGARTIWLEVPPPPPLIVTPPKTPG